MCNRNRCCQRMNNECGCGCGCRREGCGCRRNACNCGCRRNVCGCRQSWNDEMNDGLVLNDDFSTDWFDDFARSGSRCCRNDKVFECRCRRKCK